ncbi:Lhr family ATP-dependent helicase [Mycetocola reblochoni]|uniref:DEAD/DEAH box helicase n=1 Tax=Mycetocola reblochoni TaxID=331618 RepID=A0A3L6ZNU0_9MICO|nr:DEAD/DEAH box helicase [Mycetocola reblochoni]RLP69325.1 DEAD/DEAH box helicase [Mycetocola reblochoni]
MSTRFSAATRRWFTGVFAAPTAVQTAAWAAIARAEHALIIAPTGSGKTLSAFLWSIDRLISEPRGGARGTRVLYISPLKALGVDVERNLHAPLAGITAAAAVAGEHAEQVTIGVRSGDTTAAQRRALLSSPPDILITTPESLYLMLTSAARDTLRSVDTVIIDEIHAIAASKRGAHLAVSLERLDALLAAPAQRIGLSATVRPAEEVARFLGGAAPVTIVNPAASKRFQLSVTVPVADMTSPGPAPGAPRDEDGGAPDALWPHIEESIVDRVLAHRSTIVFANSRRLAERLTARMNEIYERRVLGPADPVRGGRPPAEVLGSGQTGPQRDDAPVLALAHHGSVSKERRAAIEEALKSGQLRCVVATSSLELGIDMGDVDLVVQVESPPSVASGLQRVGRAGHQVGEVSRGALYPKHRGDVLQSAVVTERMRAGLIEAIAVPRNPLDILAQQTIAHAALEPVPVDAWFEAVRRSAPFRTLPRSAFDATLELVSGRYPSERFGELRPRLVWDRDAGTLSPRPGAQRLAVTSGGTIPDRGQYGVFMVGDTQPAADGRPSAASGSVEPAATHRAERTRTAGARVGELDEEMVYESRVGDVIALGATSWRIQEITFDRVLVTPAFGQPGRLPFWKGDAIGRPAELGRALGAFTRELDAADGETAAARLDAIGLDGFAAQNLLGYIAEQREATGRVPSDRMLVLERSRDELGDWRLLLHSPYGLRVHAPWALAVGARIEERFGVEASAVAGDDGIIVRLPDTDAELPGAELFVFDEDELERLVTERVGGSALFASRFRECAARALLLPTLAPGKRSPLWQQRQRSAQLLDVARDHPQFPITLEAVRECLQDVYELPALLDLARRINARSVQIVTTTTQTPSPFARSMLFGYVGEFMYEGDSPLAERKAAALALDNSLLAELLGTVELSDLLDADVILRTEAELQRTAPDRRLRGVEGAADLLRLLGPLSAGELALRLRADEAADSAPGASPDGDRTTDQAGGALRPEQAEALAEQLATARRAIRLPVAGEARWAAIEDAGRLRDALGVPLPIGIPRAFTEVTDSALAELLTRFARSHGPFTTAAASAAFGLGTAAVHAALSSLAADGVVTTARFLPDVPAPRTPDESQWCDVRVLRRLRMRSLAALRQQVEAVSPAAFARFLPRWQGVGGQLRGVDGVLRAIEQLSGASAPASAWESLILPQRVADYSPAMLDELTAAGEVVWSGTGTLSGRDGLVALHLAETAPLTLAAPDGPDPSALGAEVLGVLARGGGFFLSQIAQALDRPITTALIDAVWDLCWSGRITNDTFAPVRTLLSGRGAHRTASAPARASVYRARGLRSAAASASTPSLAGRWSVLPGLGTTTERAAATAEVLLDRYGVVTRGSVVAEGKPGGFALSYRVLSEFEDTGRVRRGYFIDGLGAAQFASSAAVDELRSRERLDEADDRDDSTLLLAATDPANPYGAALPWPSREDEASPHRPARKAGAMVVLRDGRLVAYLERGGRTLLLLSDDEDDAEQTARVISGVVTAGSVDQLTIEVVNGAFVIGQPFAFALRRAGFSETPKGFRIRRGYGRAASR